MLNKHTKNALLLLSSALTIPFLGVAAHAETNEATNAEPEVTNEITVTASRRSESLSKVPLSITAVTQETMDVKGIKTVEDIVRLTPGVSFEASGINGNPSIIIRGLAAAAGAATTGIYIDDVPVHARVVGYASSSPMPIIFDLERVEVLRGPQGTLFGAGSEGGAVRFIQAKPSVDTWSGYARIEGSTINHGSGSYELGGALGGPIIDGVLGFRASVFQRHTGGWIDRVTGDLSLVAADHSLGAQSIQFNQTGVWEKDSNYSDATVARAALEWKPSAFITVSPSFYYQKVTRNDLSGLIWSGISDLKAGQFKAVQFLPGVDDEHIDVSKLPLNYPATDIWKMPSLNIEWDVGPVTLTSTTSYLERKVDQVSDYVVSHSVAYGQRQIPYANDYNISDHHQRQKNFTQELRFQTNDASSPLQLVGGLYFEKKKQRSVQGVDSNMLTLRNPYFTAENDGAPFGEGVSAFVNYYGMGGLTGYNGSEGSLVYYHNFYAIDTQYAAFAQADWEFVDRLKLTAGLRYSRNKTSFAAIYNGAENNANAPQGYACLPGTYTTGCEAVEIGEYAVGEGPFAPAFNNSSSKGKDSALTPKFGLEFQATPTDMYYVSASKGFRPGAAQGIMGEGCSTGLAAYGFVDENGKGASPATYERDSVWSYEVGAKNSLFGGAVRANASAFMMKWDNIQSSVFITACNQAFVTNLGSATGLGFDLDLAFDVSRNLALGVQMGYAKISFDDDVTRGGATLYTEGSAIPNSGPPFRLSVSGDYNKELSSNATGYVHVDYAYTSPYRRTFRTDPGSAAYDPYMDPIGKTELVNARIGVRFDDFDLSVFAYNLFDSTDLTYDGRDGAVYYSRTFQPRTIGLTASYRM